MKELGRHILVEMYDCDPVVLNDQESVNRMMLQAAELAGATIVGNVIHKFSPQGVSGVVVIAESHLSIHTWPESGYAALDLFTCGDTVDPWIAFEYIERKLKAGRTAHQEMKRGIIEVSETHIDLPRTELNSFHFQHGDA